MNSALRNHAAQLEIIKQLSRQELFDCKGGILRTGKKALRISVEQEQDEYGEAQAEE